MAQHTHTIGPVAASHTSKNTARSIAEAEAARSLEAMALGPVVIPPPAGSNKFAALVWPNVGGTWAWGYVGTIPGRFREIESGIESKNDAIYRAVYDIMQDATDKGSTPAQREALGAWAGKVLGDEGQGVILAAEMNKYAAFQRRYATARAEGKSDVEAHAIALDAPHLKG